jgi:hypothetical protein
LAVRAGRATGNETVDAVESGVLTYSELVGDLSAAIGLGCSLVPVARWLGLKASKILGACVRDVSLPDEEIGALRDVLLVGRETNASTRPIEVPKTPDPALLRNPLSEWLCRGGGDLGTTYANEMERRTASLVTATD